MTAMIEYPEKPEFRRIDTPFDLESGVTLLKSSEGMGWTGVYAQVTHEGPHESLYQDTRDIWFVLPLQPLKVNLRTGLRQQQGLLPPDSIVLTGAEESSRVQLGNKTRLLHVFIRYSIFEEVVRDMIDSRRHIRGPIASVFGLRDRGLSLMLRSIKQALDDPTDVSAMKVEYLARAIATHVLGHHDDWAMRDRQRLGGQRFKAVIEYLQDNLGHTLRLEDLAAIANLGRTAFIRQFKASTGQTPHQYVMLARVRRACEMLERTRLPLSDIAYACGFADQAHMSTSFKRLVGVTPSRYRSEFF